MTHASNSSLPVYNIINAVKSPEMRREMVQDGRAIGNRTDVTPKSWNPWPMSEWAMADQAEINGACLLLLAPALWGPVPNGIAHTHTLVAVHTASAALCLARAFPAALYGPLVPVYPPGPPHPRSGLSQATTSPSWFFCPARTEPVVPLLSQTQLHCT